MKKDKLVLGIDEAGRGPVIGPLVMCGYMMNESDMHKLHKIGVKDSKLLSSSRREQLAPDLLEICKDYIVLKIDAEEIDSFRSVSNLNRIEIEKMAEIINSMNPDKVIVDAIEANTKSFKKKLSAFVDKDTEIIAENYADKNYKIVGAASIIAKTHRDAAIKELHKKYGFFGSGYTSDPETVKFLKTWIKNNKEFPPCVRSTWITAVLMKNEKEQKNLIDFGDK